MELLFDAYEGINLADLGDTVIQPQVFNLAVYGLLFLLIPLPNIRTPAILIYYQYQVRNVSTVEQ